MKKETELRFRQLMKKIDYYNNISNSLSWDMRVVLPPAAAEYRGDTMGFLANEVHRLKTSGEMQELLEELSEEPIPDFLLNRMFLKAKREYDKLTRIPPALFSEYAAHNLKTELVWQDARAANDYPLVLPYLKKEFALKKELACCFGSGDDPMTGLMDEWETGTTRGQIDTLFEELKGFILPLLEEIKGSGKQFDRSYLRGHYPAQAQRDFCREMLRTVGYDFSCGRLDESAHPYTTPNFRTDIRLTTRIFEDDFTNAAISSMHEGGHAIHWQHMSPQLDGTTLAVAASLPIDESQSRFMENIIGRSREFWSYFLPVAKKYFPGMRELDPEMMYRSLNAVTCDPRRLNADELTYNLHIMIRYEIEKLIFDGAVQFEELPAIWNQKTEEYLGVRPRDDAEGILQDMHWFSGYICYFQSYVLGNCYDGHFLHKMRQDIPDLFEQVRQGEFSGIVGWLSTNVHQYGASLTPAEVLKRAAGETLSAKRYISYIDAKYRDIYGI